MSKSPFQSVEGTDLGEGKVRVERWEAFLWADATRNDEDAFRWAQVAEQYGIDRQLVPPEYGMNVVRKAIETDLDDLGLEPDWDKGIFHAGQEFEFFKPLVVEETYTVSGELTDVERKEGSSGEFDLVTQAFEVTDEGDDPIFDTISRVILMR